MKILTGIEISVLKDDDGKLYRQTVIGAGDKKTVCGIVALPAKTPEAMQDVLEEAQHRIYQIFLDDVAGN